METGCNMFREKYEQVMLSLQSFTSEHKNVENTIIEKGVSLPGSFRHILLVIKI